MYLVINKCVTAAILSNFSRHYLRNRSTLGIGVLCYLVYFNLRNILPKSGIFLPGHPVFQTKVVEKIKTHFVFNNFFFFRKSCRLWNNVEKYCRAGRQCARMRIACWIPKATKSHRICNAFLSHCNNGCTNAPRCYVIRMLSVLLNF